MSVDVHTDEDSISEPLASRRRPFSRGIVVALLVVIISIVSAWYILSRGTEDTDDAQVDGHLVPIASRIDGTIKTISVDDNETVKAGETLVELDPRDYRVALDEAKAQYDQATAQVSAASPNLPMTRIANEADLTSGAAEIAAAAASVAAARQDLAVTIARLKESQAINERAQANLQRYQTLFDKHEVSHADYDQYKATADAQVQTVAANQAAVGSAEQIVDQRQAQLAVERSKLNQSQSSAPLRVAIRDADIKTQIASAEAAQAAYEKAILNVGYTRITAPVNGVVTERSAEPGARVSSGQQLLMIVQTDDLWVTANFKETQLARMHPGQRVVIAVDALHESLAGTVESMPAVTGARTSVLPPENATGNYVKVIQRMPVRIRLNPGQNGLENLRPGMSVEPKVYVE